MHASLPVIPRYKLNRDFLKKAGSVAEAGLRLRQLFGLDLGAGSSDMAWPGGFGSFDGQVEPEDVRPEACLYAQELADLYRMTGQYELMLDEYLKVLERDPDRKEEVYTRLQAVMASSSLSETGARAGDGLGTTSAVKCARID